MQKAIKIPIRVKPYIALFIATQYGNYIEVCTANPFGMVVFSMLQNKRQYLARINKQRMQHLLAPYTQVINFYIYKSAASVGNRIFLLPDHQVIINQFFEKIFTQALYYYVSARLQSNIAYQQHMVSFLKFHELPINEAGIKKWFNSLSHQPTQPNSASLPPINLQQALYDFCAQYNIEVDAHITYDALLQLYKRYARQQKQHQPVLTANRPTANGQRPTPNAQLSTLNSQLTLCL